MEVSILFVCSQSGARSRFAHAYARRLLGDEARIECAGFQQGEFGPLIRRIMDEDGISFPLESPKTVFEHFAAGQEFDYVVFLCDTAMMDLCQLLQSDVNELFNQGEVLVRWAVPPFSDLTGSDEERLHGARAIRDGIRRKVEELAVQLRNGTIEPSTDWKC